MRFDQRKNRMCVYSHFVKLLNGHVDLLDFCAVVKEVDKEM